MKLTRARVTNYKSIDDSGWVSLDNVTCMVGKNESGKTAFLQAIRRINPADGANGSFDLRDYPRKGYVRYRRRHEEEPATVVRAEFQLTESEVEEIESNFGRGVMLSNTVVASKNYKNQRAWDLDIDETALVQHLIDSEELPLEVKRYLEQSATWEELQNNLRSLEVKPEAVERLLRELPGRFQIDIRQQIILHFLEKFLPAFVYFDNYSAMRGRISIQDIMEREANNDEVEDADRTFLALLAMVGADLDDLETQTSYEYLKAELESASIGANENCN